MGTRVLKKTDGFLKKIPVHPTFILLFLWFILTKNFISFFLFVSVVITHELGHYWVAKKLGYKLDSFFIAPYGVSLNYKDKVFEMKDEILIALAGPFVNVFLSLVVVSLWWAAPSLYNYSYIFVEQSFILGLFNLLPCYPLDGGRILVGILSHYIPRKKAVNIVYRLNYCFSALLLICFFVTCFINFNPTLCLSGVFLLFGVFESKYDSKYQSISVFKKENKNFSKPYFITVNEDVLLSSLLKHIEINRLTIFVIVFKNGKSIFLDENKVKNLSLIYPINSSLKEIIRQDKE